MKSARSMRGHRGSAMIEFALILPMLLLVLFAIVEFAIALYDKAVITNASREAARAGVVFKVPQLTTDQIKAVAVNNCEDFLISFGTAAPSVTVSHPSGTGTGDPLTVTVSYPYTGLVLGAWLHSVTDALELSATTTMNYE